MTLDEVLAVRADAVNRLAGLGSPWVGVDPAAAVDIAKATAETLKLCDAWLARNGKRADSMGFAAHGSSGGYL